jgi:hypothetical protein
MYANYGSAAFTVCRIPVVLNVFLNVDLIQGIYSKALSSVSVYSS